MNNRQSRELLVDCLRTAIRCLQIAVLNGFPADPVVWVVDPTDESCGRSLCERFNFPIGTRPIVTAFPGGLARELYPELPPRVPREIVVVAHGCVNVFAP